MPVIAIEGMKFNAWIGCYPEEKLLSNEIEVSVKIFVPVKFNQQADDIGRTINYENIFQLVKEVMQEPKNLLETAVHQIIRRIADNYSTVKRIKVRVAKLNPPIPGRVNKVWVEDEWVSE